MDAFGAAAGGLIQHGETGLVVLERDVDALAAALQQLLADSTLRARLGRATREKVLKWDNARMVAGFQDAIAHVLEWAERGSADRLRTMKENRDGPQEFLR
jgi:glycosyltransferase involved in cell wall biosynthesis